jgi:hypothetical protein
MYWSKLDEIGFDLTHEFNKVLIFYIYIIIYNITNFYR